MKRHDDSEKMTFYFEWLSLEKNEFAVISMLADRGAFRGCLADICRYFSVSSQSKNNARFRSAIERLTEKGFIICDLQKRTYRLEMILQEQEIKIPRRWYMILKKRDYTAASVAWEQVLKVLLWIIHNKLEVVTNKLISDDLCISESTIVSTKKVLKTEYEAITREKVSEKYGDDQFRTIGQRLNACAWWNEA